MLLSSMISLRIGATSGHYIGVRRCWPSHSRDYRASSAAWWDARDVAVLCLLLPLRIICGSLYCNITLYESMEHDVSDSISRSLEKGSPGTCP